MSVSNMLNTFERAHYPFKRYPKKASETVLFMGCAFPSQFPRTTDALAARARNAGFGIVYDCCGSALVGLGKPEASERVLDGVRRRLDAIGCKRLVLACPNCLEHFTGRLPFEVVPIYSVLDELGLEQPVTFDEGNLFLPCPDRRTRTLESTLRAAHDLSKVSTLEHAPCCGLRSDILARGAEYSTKVGAVAVEQAAGAELYTYCASCAGQFTRLGCTSCRHVLSVILNIDEQPDASRALLNRMRRKLDRNTGPAPGERGA